MKTPRIRCNLKYDRVETKNARFSNRSDLRPARAKDIRRQNQIGMIVWDLKVQSYLKANNIGTSGKNYNDCLSRLKDKKSTKKYLLYN